MATADRMGVATYLFLAAINRVSRYSTNRISWNVRDPLSSGPDGTSVNSASIHDSQRPRYRKEARENGLNPGDQPRPVGAQQGIVSPRADAATIKRICKVGQLPYAPKPGSDERWIRNPFGIAPRN
jgi:hypothetical protein